MFGIMKVLKGMNLPGMSPGVMNRLEAAPDPRVQFNALLLTTVSHVSQKPNFNLDLEINDLWTRLSVLKQEQAMAKAPGATLSSVAGAVGEINQQLGKVLEAMLKSPPGVGR